jgi:hypothetical protein
MKTTILALLTVLLLGGTAALAADAPSPGSCCKKDAACCKADAGCCKSGHCPR